jgi:hypothetical protein
MTLRRSALSIGAYLLPLAALGGCGTVLGLGDFEDAESGATTTSAASSGSTSSGTGGSGTGGAGATTGTTGTGGGGGGGGGKLVGNCSLQAEAFDVFSANDLAGQDIDTHSVRVIRAGNDTFHVTAASNTNQTLYARSVHGGGSLGPIASFASQFGIRVSSAIEDGDITRVAAIIDNEVAEVFFQHNGGDISANGATKQSWGSDPGCNNGPQRLGFAWEGSMPFWAYSCDGGMGTTLVAGDGQNGSFQISSGVMDSSNDVRRYGRIGGRHLVVTGSDGPGASFLRYGLTSDDLGTAYPLVIDDTPGYASLVAGLAPHPVAGLVFVGATLKLSPFDATLWAGHIADYTAFGSVPPTGLAPIVTYNDPAQVGEQSELVLGTQAVGFTRVPFTQKDVSFSWLTDEGAPLLIDFPVQSAPAGTTYWNTDVGIGLGNLNVLVVWLESTSGAFAVRGQRLICGTAIE